MENPCEICIYASKNTDPIGNDYYTCDIDDFTDNDPENYYQAECCKKGDD